MTGVTAGQAAPAEFATWFRIVYPSASDGTVARAWDDRPTGEREFWAAIAARQPQPAPELTADGKPDVGTAWRLLGEARAALERLGDDDPVLDEGLGGGATEELHVRINLARQVLGREVCGCTECIVSLGLDPEDAQ